MAVDPESFLPKLVVGAEVAVGTVRGLAGALPALEASGLVAVRADGKKKLVTLTADGEARRAAVAAAAPAPKSRSRSAAAGGDLAELRARVEALDAAVRARLDGLEAAVLARLAGLEAALAARIDARAAAAVSTRATPGDDATPSTAPVAVQHGDAVAPVAPETVDRAALETLEELDVTGRLGGLVPLPDLRRALAARGIADPDAVTAALERLEQAWKIDLNVAQSPLAVEDRAAGIERPGRGLLYYATRR